MTTDWKSAQRVQAKQLARVLPVLRTVARHDRVAGLMNRPLAPFNPIDPRHHIDPYPQYRALRERGPVFHHRRVSTWYVTGYEETELALRAPSSVDRSQVFELVPPYSDIDPSVSKLMTTMMLLQDPPDHTRLRKLVNRAFTPRAIAKLEPLVVEATDRLIDDMDSRSSVDLVDTFTSRLPIFMIGELLGLANERWAELKDLSDELAKFVDPFTGFQPSEFEATVEQTVEMFRSEFDERRARPRDDLMSALVEAEEEGDRLSDDEMVSMCLLLMVAGHETTTGLLGTALVALDTHRGAREQLLADPELAAQSVEEFLRYDSPVQMTLRLMTNDTRLGSETVPAGAAVQIVFAAANRDPRRYDQPDELRLDRPDPRPLAFGHGVHHCVGAALARLEAKVAISRFVERHPNYSVDRDRLEWKRSLGLRGPAVLPVNL